MSNLMELAEAWARVDERIRVLREDHRKDGNEALFEAEINAPATDADLATLQKALGVDIPLDLSLSLKWWNGRWIAPDHAIEFASVEYLKRLVPLLSWADEDATLTFESVVGPINPLMHSKKRVYFGRHEYSGSMLFIDYEDPPEGGRLGQVIRIGEEPIAQWVAGSFVEFLNLVADAPAHDDDPDFDPLRWPR